jgi:hypothetical protein
MKNRFQNLPFKRNLQRYTEEAKEAAQGWHDPAPYPFVLASATPSLGSEHLIVPVVGTLHRSREIQLTPPRLKATSFQPIALESNLAGFKI